MLDITQYPGLYHDPPQQCLVLCMCNEIGGRARVERPGLGGQGRAGHLFEVASADQGEERRICFLGRRWDILGSCCSVVLFLLCLLDSACGRHIAAGFLQHALELVDGKVCFQYTWRMNLVICPCGIGSGTLEKDYVTWSARRTSAFLGSNSGTGPTHYLLRLGVRQRNLSNPILCDGPLASSRLSYYGG